MLTAQFMVKEPGKSASVDIYHTTTQEAVERLERHLNETGGAKTYSLAHVEESAEADPSKISSKFGESDPVA